MFCCFGFIDEGLEYEKGLVWILKGMGLLMYFLILGIEKLIL